MEDLVFKICLFSFVGVLLGSLYSLFVLVFLLGVQTCFWGCSRLFTLS